MTDIDTTTCSIEDERKARRRASKSKYADANKEKRASYDREYYNQNKDQIIARKTIWKACNPEKVRRYARTSRAAKYNMTAEAWDLMFKAQEESCAVCRSPEPKSKQDWHTDHDHATGEVRGILCRACNHLLGHAEDNIETLSNAITYLKKTHVH